MFSAHYKLFSNNLKQIKRHTDCFSFNCSTHKFWVRFTTEGGRLASGFWPAVSGAKAQEKALEIVSNNIANMNTLAFKKDQPTFQEYLATEERSFEPRGIALGEIRDKDLNPINGKDKSFVIMDSTYSDFSQGHLKVTQNPLDVALDGPGFLEVYTPSGVRFVRQGSLKIATDGTLTTKDGHPVLSFEKKTQENAQPATAVQSNQGGLNAQGGATTEPKLEEIQRRFINLRDVGNKAALSINNAGEIFNGPDSVGKISLVEFLDPRKLRKEAGQLFLNPNTDNKMIDVEKTTLNQGMLETSNVNPAEEMQKLIKSHRLFEHNLRALKTYDQMMDKESNEIGAL